MTKCRLLPSASGWLSNQAGTKQGIVSFHIVMSVKEVCRDAHRRFNHTVSAVDLLARFFSPVSSRRSLPSMLCLLAIEKG